MHQWAIAGAMPHRTQQSTVPLVQPGSARLLDNCVGEFVLGQDDEVIPETGESHSGVPGHFVDELRESRSI